MDCQCKSKLFQLLKPDKLGPSFDFFPSRDKYIFHGHTIKNLLAFKASHFISRKKGPNMAKNGSILFIQTAKALKMSMAMN